MDATPVVVDTDVISYLFKSHPLATAYQTILAGRPLAVSIITDASWRKVKSIYLRPKVSANCLFVRSEREASKLRTFLAPKLN